MMIFRTPNQHSNPIFDYNECRLSTWIYEITVKIPSSFIPLSDLYI